MRSPADGWQPWPENTITPDTYFVAVVTGFIQLKWAGYYKCALPPCLQLLSSHWAGLAPMQEGCHLSACSLPWDR